MTPIMHQDPLAAAMLYTGPLPQLMFALTREARERPGEWHARKLPRGAIVAVRVSREDGRRLLQLHRPLGAMKDQEKRDRMWHEEINIFLRMFKAQEWEPTDSVPLTTAAVLTAAFQEPKAA